MKSQRHVLGGYAVWMALLIAAYYAWPGLRAGTWGLIGLSGVIAIVASVVINRPPVRLIVLMLASLIAPAVLFTESFRLRGGRRERDRGVLRGRLPARAVAAVGRDRLVPPRARPGASGPAGELDARHVHVPQIADAVDCICECNAGTVKHEYDDYRVRGRR